MNKLTTKNVTQNEIGLLYEEKCSFFHEIIFPGIPEVCDAAKSYETNADQNFKLECSWCPGHKVTEVNTTHIEDVKNHASIYTSGIINSPYPVKIDMTKDETKYEDDKMTVTATIEYGLLKVTVEMFRTACNYDEYYEFKASATEVESKKLVNVTINGKLLLTLIFHKLTDFVNLSVLAHLASDFLL